MNKKTGIIIGILVVFIIVLIGIAFVGDANDPYIITIDGVKYSKDDFTKYYKIRYFEEMKNQEKSNDEDVSDVEESPDVSTEGENDLLNSIDVLKEKTDDVDKEELREPYP